MYTEPIILLVDDEPASLQTLESILTGQGYRLYLAESGTDALQMARDLLPDVILLDVMMPTMDGFEVCRRLRNDSSLAEAPILLVTALDDDESRLHGLEVGADDFVSKPFNRSELRSRVRTITRLNRYRRLINQRQRFEWIAEQSSDGFVIADRDGVIQYANPQAFLYLCVSQGIEDPIGLDFAELAKRQYLCEPEEARHDWPSFLSEENRTCYLVRPETYQSPALWLAVSALNQTGESNPVILYSMRDVTAQVTAWRDMRTFHTVIGHKLLTPLNILVGSLEILADDREASDSEIREMVEIAYEGGSRVQSTIEGILFYLKGENILQIGGHVRLHELPPLIERAAERLEVHDIDVSIETTLAENSIGLSSQSLEWIFVELLENAKKFHPQNSPTVEVVASLDRPGWTRIETKDDGVNLSVEQIGQVWMPYYQGEKYFTGELPGIGLGLPTVAATIWHLGGDCKLSNRAASPGVSVEFTLPLVE